MDEHTDTSMDWSDIGEKDTSSTGSVAPTGSARQQAKNEVSSVYEAHAHSLSVMLRKAYGNGPPDPEDVSQQAFLKLIEKGNLASITNVKAYLWRTASNIIFGSARTSSTRSKYDFEVEQLFFPLQDDEATPERILLAEEQFKVINQALREMPDKRRRAVILHRIDGLSAAEIGRRLGMSRQSAAKHIARGIADINIAVMQSGEPSLL